jgi:(p)ppGpp synthase/HD superfamily hydrolase
MKEWVIVLKAADAAARWHVHQRRKGKAKEPYNHLLEVASLVADATAGQDPELVIAALLHDAIEDQEVPAERISEAFGAGVAEIVLEVTDDKRLPKSERKAKQVHSAPKKSQRAKVLKLADKTSNLRAIAATLPRIGPLSEGRSMWRGHVRSPTACVERIRGLKSALMRRLN